MNKHLLLPFHISRVLRSSDSSSRVGCRLSIKMILLMKIVIIMIVEWYMI